MTTSHYFK